MTLDQYRAVADRLLNPFVDVVDRLGVSPNGVSIVAFGFAVGAGGAFGIATTVSYVLGAVCVFWNGWLDLVDGALARERGVSSDGGDLLDHVLDRYADIAMLIGLAAGSNAYALGFAAVTGVLMTSYLGTQIQAIGLGREYGGLVGRADRLALIGITGVLAAVTTLPTVPTQYLGLSVVGWLLLFFAIVGHLTAIQRFYYAWSDL
jgi:archaetidylinositol phosphate synthase